MNSSYQSHNMVMMYYIKKVQVKFSYLPLEKTNLRQNFQQETILIMVTGAYENDHLEFSLKCY